MVLKFMVRAPSGFSFPLPSCHFDSPFQPHLDLPSLILPVLLVFLLFLPTLRISSTVLLPLDHSSSNSSFSIPFTICRFLYPFFIFSTQCSFILFHFSLPSLFCFLPFFLFDFFSILYSAFTFFVFNSSLLPVLTLFPFRLFSLSASVSLLFGSSFPYSVFNFFSLVCIPLRFLPFPFFSILFLCYLFLPHLRSYLLLFLHFSSLFTSCPVHLFCLT